MGRIRKTMKFWRGHPFLLLAIALFIAGVVYETAANAEVKHKNISQVTEMLRKDKVATLTFYSEDHQVDGVTKSGKRFTARYPDSLEEKLTAEADAHKVSIKGDEHTFIGSYWVIIGFLIILIWCAIVGIKNEIDSATGKKSVAAVTKKNLPTERFDDVKGAPEAIETMARLVDFLKYPKRYTGSGIKLPRGVILHGPPGTGKTLLGRATAGEAEVNFLFISGSDLIKKWAGATTESVRKLFDQIDPTEPIVVFFDEVDGIATRRTGEQGADRDTNTAVVQLLHEIDELFRKNQFAILIATTNRMDALDPALIRPDRFGVHIAMPEPDREGRKAILQVNASKITGVDPGVNFDYLSRMTAGMSGATLATIPNQAALLAMQEVQQGSSSAQTAKNTTAMTVTLQHFIEALAAEEMGVPRKHAYVSEDAQRLTACHEAGRTLVAMLEKHAPDPFRVTIIPVEMTGGSTWFIQHDQPYPDYEIAMAQLTYTMGGYAAERIILGRDSFTSMPSRDRQAATKLAIQMVCEWGMGTSSSVFVEANKLAGHPYAHQLQRDAQEHIVKASRRAEKLLKQNVGALKAIQEALLEHRTIGRDELNAIAWQHCPQALIGEI